MLTNIMGVKAARKRERKCQEKQEFTVKIEKMIKMCRVFFVFFIFFILQEWFQYSLPLYEQSYDTAQGSSNSKLLIYCTR